MSQHIPQNKNLSPEMKKFMQQNQKQIKEKQKQLKELYNTIFTGSGGEGDEKIIVSLPVKWYKDGSIELQNYSDKCEFKLPETLENKLTETEQMVVLEAFFEMVNDIMLQWGSQMYKATQGKPAA